MLKHDGSAHFCEKKEEFPLVAETFLQTCRVIVNQKMQFQGLFRICKSCSHLGSDFLTVVFFIPKGDELFFNVLQNEKVGARKGSKDIIIFSGEAIFNVVI